MSRRAIIICAALATLVGCDREAKRPPPLTVDAPSGQGTYVDGEGVRRPLFTTLGMLTYDQTVEGTLPAINALAGYEFLVEAGDAPRLALADTGGEALLALYGPRSADGLWGQPVLVVQGDGPLVLALDPVNQGGSWFVLLRDEAERARPYALTLTCEGCAAPACAPAPCDLVCAQGFRVDGEGCRECACVAEVACEPACGADARCVDGICQPLECAERCPRTVAPVCGADRRTYPNRCVADCAEVQVVAEGACPEACAGPQDCAAGQQCLDGRCVVDTCGCDLTPAPVCAVGGETFRNGCLLACAGAEPAYEGVCVRRPCQTAQDCGDGSVC
ncbi:MAG: hypothetical protein KC613_27815, partial [Myxococcales bacterium]|nr:hypothetical protein [Myxococcales bacterium]